MEESRSVSFALVRDVKIPARGTHRSAGIDFFVPNDWNSGQCYFLDPGQDVLIPSGVHVKLPRGYALIAFNKSGLATKSKLQVGACVVDEDYQGEIHIHVHNLGRVSIAITPGQKLTQFLLLPINYVKWVPVEYQKLYKKQTRRGKGGFGSTGK